MTSRSKQKGYLTIILMGVLLACIAGAGLYMRIQSGRIADLTAKLAVAEQVVQFAQVINQTAANEIDSLKVINQRCAHQRMAAETRARKASEAIESSKEASEKVLREEAREVRNENSESVCSSPVPARTTELLVAAAIRANQGGDGR